MKTQKEATAKESGPARLRRIDDMQKQIDTANARAYLDQTLQEEARNVIKDLDERLVRTQRAFEKLLEATKAATVAAEKMAEAVKILIDKYPGLRIEEEDTEEDDAPT